MELAFWLLMLVPGAWASYVLYKFIKMVWFKPLLCPICNSLEVDKVEFIKYFDGNNVVYKVPGMFCWKCESSWQTSSEQINVRNTH